jgi:hypothetical protein
LSVLKIGVMDPDTPAQARTERARRVRSLMVVFLLFVVTTLALVLSWAHPLATSWHFWGVTQFLPLFYLALSVWAAWPLAGEEER